MNKKLNDLRNETLKAFIEENEKLKNQYLIMYNLYENRKAAASLIEEENYKLGEENKMLRQAVNELRQALLMKQRIWINDGEL